MSITQIKKASTKQVESILSDEAVATLTAMDETLKNILGVTSLSEVEKSFQAAIAKDPTDIPLSKAIESYIDILSKCIDQILTIERFITLHMPKMEDGNNFGVTVQMTVSKALSEARESMTKKLDAIPSYYSSRADAVDKLGLIKGTVSKTETKSVSEATGGKDGDEKKTSQTSVEEVKTVGNDSEKSGAAIKLRLLHIASLDVQCYSNIRYGLLDSMNTYLMIVDNVEKNKEKLTEPKGSSGGTSHMGMY